MIKKLNETAEFIKSKMPAIPKVAITLGSGLGDFVDSIANPVIIENSTIPNFHSTTVSGHQGRLIFGEISNIPIMAIQGRIHTYEGHSLEDVVFATRVVKHIGCNRLILTNASGGINTTFVPGQLVLIKDHINLTGRNPLIGNNIEELGPRFPDMGDVYTRSLRQNIKKAAEKIGYKMTSGIYAGVLGPCYETPAEVRMLRALGADMVGMSTVPEAIAARHCGLELAGISCITNMAAGVTDDKLNHDDIKEESRKVMNTFIEILKGTIVSL